MVRAKEPEGHQLYRSQLVPLLDLRVQAERKLAKVIEIPELLVHHVEHLPRCLWVDREQERLECLHVSLLNAAHHVHELVIRVSEAPELLERYELAQDEVVLVQIDRPVCKRKFERQH